MKKPAHPIWELLASKLKADSKGRYKTTEVIHVAKGLMDENLELRKLLAELGKEISKRKLYD